jgi:hypothetical protein
MGQSKVKLLTLSIPIFKAEMAVLFHSASRKVAPSQELLSLLAKTIQSWKLTDIIRNCRNCGMPVTGRKEDLASCLATVITQPAPVTPWTVVSLDIGVFNFAKAIIKVPKSGRPVLLEWDRFSLDLPALYHPRSHALKLQAFAQELVANKSLTERTVFLIEKQSTRGGGMRMIPGNILNVNRIEVQLHCFLLDHHVYSVDPRNVAALYGLTVRDKKQAAISQVETFCKGDAPVDIPPDLIDAYRRERKRDDMADSLLQGLAHIEWQTNLGRLRDDLYSQIGNRASLEPC